MNLDFDFDEIESALKISTNRNHIDLTGYKLIHDGLCQIYCNGKHHIEIWRVGNAFYDCDCEFWDKLK